MVAVDPKPTFTDLKSATLKAIKRLKHSQSHDTAALIASHVNLQ
jgi:hypothetical protein